MQTSESPPHPLSMKKKKLLLLEPPGRKTYIRDYYCSKTSKTNYKYPALDLITQSGYLSKDFDLYFLDAILERYTPLETIQTIQEIHPEIIYLVNGAVSFDEDQDFLKMVKHRFPSMILIVSGDAFMDGNIKLVERNSHLDAVALDFTNSDVLYFLQGQYHKIERMIFRQNGQYQKIFKKREINTSYDIPLPRHELFMNKKYRYPYIRKTPFAPILTDYGCVYNCTFCIMAISSLGFKYRSVDKVMEELRHLHHLGCKELIFLDQTFGANKARNTLLLNKMIEAKFQFGWCCFCRADVVDQEFLILMKSAGCHTIFWGVETSDDAILKKYQKGLKINKVHQAFAWTRKIGITNVGNFIFGFAEDTPETMKKTLDLAIELKCDYAAFHTMIPRKNTRVRDYAIEQKWIREDTEVMDQSGEFVMMGGNHLTSHEILKFRQYAVRKFYLRPGYLFHRLINIKSLYQFRNEFMQGIEMIKTGF